MSEWEAPAKLNLDLRVRPPDASGLHPIRSITQTIEWCDVLSVEAADEDRLRVLGAELSSDEDNLVWRAIEALQLADRPRLDLVLTKRVAIAAGLGGGSSDAAAALAAVGHLVGLDPDRARSAAPTVGSDVAFFLDGGTALMEGYGSELTALPAFGGFAVAVAVPPFELSTAEVYSRWDELDAPVADTVSDRHLPPSLRGVVDGGNDLTAAALSLRPELGDWIRELEQIWGRKVMMSGSGPACFGYFVDPDESRAAAGEVTEARDAVGVSLRTSGVAHVGDRAT